MPLIHKYLNVFEENKIGWDITYILFKDIAHSFLNNDEETKSVLTYIFEKEYEYMSDTGSSDAVFGVYHKRM